MHRSQQIRGGAHRGGVTEKQITYLHVLADKVGAEPAEDLWRAADPKRLQTQIKAAKAVRERGGKHAHRGLDEAALRIGIEDDDAKGRRVTSPWCNAVSVAQPRPVDIDPAGDLTYEKTWVLAGHLADYLVGFDTFAGPMTAAELSEYNGPDNEPAESLAGRWREPMTFAEVGYLYKTLPKSPGWGDEQRLVPVEWTCTQ